MSRLATRPSPTRPAPCARRCSSCSPTCSSARCSPPLAGHNGIFTPDGHVSPALIVLTMSVLVLRLVALFVVPALIVYRLIARAIEHLRA